MSFIRYAALFAATALSAPASAAITFSGSFSIAGNATDLSGISAVNGGNRLSVGSDLTYDATTDLFYGITDRGPGGGVIGFAPRLNVFSLATDPVSNAIAGFTLQKTVVFTRDGVTFDGLNPTLLNGNPSVLGQSFDPEGFALLKNGNLLVSDEYGPSVYEFDATGAFVRAYTTPDNLVPKLSDSTPDYTSGRPTITSGRQDNRGFEGITVSQDGTKAYAIMQDPLVNEGASNDGRRSGNLRIVEFSTATGQATKQYIYQLEPIADINGRIPGTASDFGATAQGRNIGASSITALADGTLLVIERDNRGLGVDDPTGANPIGSKRVYRIDLTGATDVSTISLAGSNGLPGGVTPVGKSLYLDIQAEVLAKSGQDVLEKLEGLTFGKILADGSLSLFIATDNDFSVTQTGSGTQLDVCTSGDGGTSTQVTLGAACPSGMNLIPTRIYGFKVNGLDARGVAVPEPATWAMMIAGFGLIGGAARARRRNVRFA